jgi:hypothetical protein
MQRKNIVFMLLAAGLLLALGTAMWLVTATPARAQCGSQASSCKNCHEVQGELPVNGDGSGWHTAHAFGDFCYLCHAGNNQATDKAEAHTGMVPPLSDIKAACIQCHPNDYEALAKEYATTLGVEVGSGAASTSSGEAASGSETVSATTAGNAPCATDLVVDDPNLVDYVQRYNEIVLGKKPFNIGNAILLGMIGIVAIGGGGFVAMRERLVKVSFGDTRKAGDEFPAEVVELLPAITGLKANSRKTLKTILDNPKKAEKVLGLVNAVISDDESEDAA